MPTTVPPATAVATDLLDAPAQLRQLTLNTVHWLRTDSVAAAIGVVVAVVLYLVFWGIRFGICRLLGDHHDITTWQGFVWRMVYRTRSFFLGALAAHLAARAAAPPGVVLSFITLVFTVAAAVQGAVWMREFILALVDRRSALAEDRDAINSAGNIIRVLVNVVVWSLAFILVLDNLGVNVTALVAGLGVGGIAIGLAAQGIFADLFAALAILFDRPFRVGDTISWGKVTGRVEAIGLKTVRIRAVTGEQVIVGNTKLLADQISNLRRIEERQVAWTIGVTYQTDPALLDRIPAEVEAIVAAHDDCRFERAHFVGFGASSLDFEVIFYTQGQAFATMLHARHAIGLAVLRRFNDLGIDFAGPAPLVYVAGSDAAGVVDAEQAGVAAGARRVGRDDALGGEAR